MGGGEGGLAWVGACFFCMCAHIKSLRSQCSLTGCFSVGICPWKRHVFFPVWEFSCHPYTHPPPPDMAAAAILEIRCEPLDGTEAQLNVLYDEARENLPENKNFLPRLF